MQENQSINPYKVRKLIKLSSFSSSGKRISTDIFSQRSGNVNDIWAIVSPCVNSKIKTQFCEVETIHVWKLLFYCLFSSEVGYIYIYVCPCLEPCYLTKFPSFQIWKDMFNEILNYCKTKSCSKFQAKRITVVDIVTFSFCKLFKNFIIYWQILMQ